MHAGQAAQVDEQLAGRSTRLRRGPSVARGRTLRAGLGHRASTSYHLASLALKRSPCFSDAWSSRHRRARRNWSAASQLRSRPPPNLALQRTPPAAALSATMRTFARMRVGPLSLGVRAAQDHFSTRAVQHDFHAESSCIAPGLAALVFAGGISHLAACTSPRAAAADLASTTPRRSKATATRSSTSATLLSRPRKCR